jgi:hypothetical protein
MEKKLWTRKWVKTLNGKINTLYDNIRRRSKERWLCEPSFTIQEFRDWFLANKGMELYNNWVSSNYRKDLRPSVDRIDCKLKYDFDNMQVITFKENIQKGRKEKIILRGKEIKQIDKDGSVLNIFPSSKAAAKAVKGKFRTIQAAARTGFYHRGFRWEYVLKEKWHRFNYIQALQELQNK